MGMDTHMYKKSHIYAYHIDNEVYKLYTICLAMYQLQMSHNHSSSAHGI
jgi:hypothetical protein